MYLWNILFIQMLCCLYSLCTDIIFIRRTCVFWMWQLCYLFTVKMYFILDILCYLCFCFFLTGHADYWTCIWKQNVFFIWLLFLPQQFYLCNKSVHVDTFLSFPVNVECPLARRTASVVFMVERPSRVREVAG